MIEDRGEKQQHNPERKINLRAGLQALPVDLRKQNEKVGWREMVHPSLTDAGTQLNEILTSIKDQGGKIIGIVPLEVMPPGDGIVCLH